ncbi:hypothetical protein [Mycobacteroides abscessus]|uniref:hypothetical protein n=1 Tax=Mycobacteroides abscessus TaxID=36809 RepID=UPI000C2691D5|nr:hypothetical protein [Mycobacteroides abscessus]
MLRTHTTVSWFAELLPDLVADPRLQLWFTIHPGSQFQLGVAEYLESLGGATIPWDSAVATTFDLAVAAHLSDGLEELATPLLILPHGPGHTRTLTQRSDPKIPIVKVRNRFGIATTVALTSEQDRYHFDTKISAAIGFAVTGDPCLDSLRVSRPARERYRHALSVEEAQTLVLISSTWGPYGALGQRPRIVDQILGELPADEYVVAAILHANIWSLHGDWQLRLWLRDALASGLRLIPHQNGWRQTVVAADVVIGDHGSVTYYAAAVDTPVLLASSAGKIEIKKRTAIQELLRTAQKLDTAAPFDIQIRDAISTRRNDRVVAPSENDPATPTDSTARIRILIYELIDLEPDPTHSDGPYVCQTPTFSYTSATAHWISASIDDTDPVHPVVSMLRTPAHGAVGDYAPPGCHHLSVNTDCPSTRLLNLADVLYDRTPTLPSVLKLMLRQRPAAMIATATATGSIVYQRKSEPISLTHPSHDTDLIASALLALATHKQPWEKLTVKAGDRRTVAVRQ